MKFINGITKIQTYTGVIFDLKNPDIDLIDIEDIAHALSMLCRFGGHTKTFYSVAQHSYEVSQLVPDDLKLTGLLHDASEAYLTDLPKPIKNLVQGYSETENKIMSIIAEKFNAIYPFPKEIKMADTDVLMDEYYNYMIGEEIGWSPGVAKLTFMNEFKKLYK